MNVEVMPVQPRLPERPPPLSLEAITASPHAVPSLWQ